LSLTGLRRTHPIGIFRDHESVGLIGRENYSTTSRLVLGHGHGLAFHLRDESPSIVLPLGRKEHLPHIADVRVSDVLDTRIMTYTVETPAGRELRLAIHEPEEGMDTWEVPSLNKHLTGSGQVVSEYRHNGQFVLFYGDKNLEVAFSKNLVAWHASGQTLASPRKDRFDRHALKLLSVAHLEQGLLVLYTSTETKRNQTTISVGVMLVSATDPEHVVWRSDEPMATFTTRATDNPEALGAVVYEQEVVVYFTSDRDKLFTLEFANPYAPLVKHRRTNISLHRFPRNPILSPTNYEWESHAVLNPAAFVDNGRVHLLYRAMGPDGISRLGYASSADGVNFDERLEYPVYTPKKGFGEPTETAVHGKKAYDIIANPSGGGWAGCEDPRAVSIDGKVYLSYVAFDGWSFVRQALTSISLHHLHAKNWKWQNPVLISKPGEIQKNWVLFPEKIGGKYAILHGLSPNIHVEYLDSLDELNGKKFIESLPQAGGHGYAGRKDRWDSRVRGAGSPPIRTPMGWLLLYHATDQRDPGKYKLGAMLLDLQDPTKVLYRANAPVLEPQEWYENDGKPGVIYTCGAVIVGENLIVYYGGGDKHIAVARANAQAFVEGLIKDHQVALTPVANFK